MPKKNAKASTGPPLPHRGLRESLVARFGKHGAVLLFAMGVLLITSLAYAGQAERPWGRTVSKRLEKKQPLQPREYAIIGLWWGAMINAALLAALLATAKKWMPEADARAKAAAATAEKKSGNPSPTKAETAPANSPAPEAKSGLVPRPQFVLVLLLAAIAVGAWVRYPRLSQSLWNDEEYAMRRFAHGSWEDKGNGISMFAPVTWIETLYENRNGNNHLLNSLITRTSLRVWRYYADAQRSDFSEVALRTPAFIAGLLTIPLIFLLGREMRAPVAGLGAAWMLVFYPWHIRYSTDAKGYSFMLFFICLALLALIRAMRRDGLHWWLVFALSEAAFLLSFAGAIYVALVINIFAVVMLLKDRQAARLWTLVAFNLLAAVPVIQWMLPSVPQIIAYLKSDDSLHLGMGWDWTQDFFSGLLLGFQYDNPLPDQHVGTGWLLYAKVHPVKLAFLEYVMSALAVVGIIIAARKNAASRLIIIAPVLAALLAYVHNAAQNSPMVVWYLLYALIPWLLAVPLSVEALQSRRPILVWASMTALVICHATATWDACQVLRQHDRQPIRQTVAFIRDQAPDALTAVFGVSDRQTLSYDPNVKTIANKDDLQALVDKASHTGFPLYVYYCGQTETTLRNPKLVAAIHDGLTDASFEKLASFKGHEELFSYNVYRAKLTKKN